MSATASATPLDILGEVFGYNSFRGPQEAIVNHAVAGGDALVLMPTGGGKSLCYYHSNFGKKAHKCEAPCTWAEN